MLSGGEKGTFRNVLVDLKVPNIALNITQFQIPKRKEVDLKELLGGANVYVYTSDEDEDVEKFDSFIRDHADDIECVIGRSDYNGEWLGDKYVPLWNDSKDLERLAYLCEKWGRVAISERAINARSLPRIRQLQQRWGCTLVGLTSRVESIEAIKWDVVIVSSWTSVRRYGETQVWDGHALRRYPAQKKESARKKHRADIVRLGCDYEAVLEDDVKEVAKLAIKSWQAYEEHEFGATTPAAYHPFEGAEEDEDEVEEWGQIVTISPESAQVANREIRGNTLAIDPPRARTETGKVLLPVLGMEQVSAKQSHRTAEGDEVWDLDPDDQPVVRYKNDGIRHCDSCYLAPRCPMFTEHAECAYSLPIEIRTKDQLQATMTAMLEMQLSRVMFARFAEELEGQGLDPTLSGEMDRYLRMIEKIKTIEDTRDFVNISVEARAGAGVLSRIFGPKAGADAGPPQLQVTQKELDQVILDADVLD